MSIVSDDAAGVSGVSMSAAVAAGASPLPLSEVAAARLAAAAGGWAAVCVGSWKATPARLGGLGIMSAGR